MKKNDPASREGIVLSFLFLLLFTSANAQTWTLWASGLPAGSFPRMTVAPNHDIYYTLLSAPNSPGIVYKANTTATSGSFSGLPAVPFPASHQNNINCLIASDSSQLIVGIMRTNILEPWIFKFNTGTNSWDTVIVTGNAPTLGAYCVAKSPVSGTIYFGAKWAYVYKSNDGGNTFTCIDESASIGANFPCYYPTWGGVNSDAAIYGINVDGNNRVYAGTESGGIVFSDDEGASWQPADLFACQSGNPNLKDSNSIMLPLSNSGNAAGIGFTSSNQLVWNGAMMWQINWPNTMGFADMNTHAVMPVSGLPQYMITHGQQVTKIVTTSNGQLFFHSGDNTHGIYTSPDGINWTPFNTGITGLNDVQSEGAFAVDGNSVFFATHDGKIWRYDAPVITALNEKPEERPLKISPNPASDFILIQTTGDAPLNFRLYNSLGQTVNAPVLSAEKNETQLDVSALPSGIYFLSCSSGTEIRTEKIIVNHPG
jgi:hypothetical protein